VVLLEGFYECKADAGEAVDSASRFEV